MTPALVPELHRNEARHQGHSGEVQQGFPHQVSVGLIDIDQNARLASPG